MNIHETELKLFSHLTPDVPTDNTKGSSFSNTKPLDTGRLSRSSSAHSKHSKHSSCAVGSAR